MKTIDKLIIGIPAAVSGVVVVATKLGATVLLLASVIAFYLGLTEKEVALEQKHLVAIAVGLATLGAFVFKQFNKFKNRKIKFMKALADSLYFKNLDNNAGVFHHLIDAAEEEEFKEAVLAYYFLLTAENDLTVDELDRSWKRGWPIPTTAGLISRLETPSPNWNGWALSNSPRKASLQGPGCRQGDARPDLGQLFCLCKIKNGVLEYWSDGWTVPLSLFAIPTLHYSNTPDMPQFIASKPINKSTS